MTYGPSASGGTLTEFRFTATGEIITHVSSTDGVIHRNNQPVHAGTVDFTYNVPFAQLDEGGAVFYLADDTSQSCTIKPAS